MADPHTDDALAATVLLVEDQAPVREFVRRALEYGGYEVVEANNGYEALAIVSRDPAAIDLILADVVMPGMSGRLLADTLANRHPGVKVLFMSGNDELVRVLNGGSMEGSTLQKPFTSWMLLERVQQALGSADS
jgi:CheY-like chemotaxis protein